MRIRITDLTVGNVMTVDRQVAADELHSWFGRDVWEALDTLQEKLNRNEYTGEEEAYLGLRIEQGKSHEQG